MRILGIDFGTKRIGLAVSDENNRLAFPMQVIANDKNALSAVAQILKEEKISEIVVGESVDFSGKPNPLEKLVEVFVSDVKKKFELPVHKEKEFLTSVEARRYGDTPKLSPPQTRSRTKVEKGVRVDAMAAALILQRYLDRKNNSEK